MKIEYFYKNIEPLGEASKNYIEDKIGSVSRLVTVRDAYVEVEEQPKEGSFSMSVTVRTKNGTEYRADEKALTVQACADIIEDELKGQIRRATEKTRDLKRRGGRSLKKKITIDENARL